MAEEQRIVVIGASAGGVEALMRLAAELPSDFPAPILVVLHVPPDSPSLLAQILDRQGPLTATTAEHRERYRPGTIYVAPPDRHLLVGNDGTLRVTRGPRENRHRPAIDPLFRSAALVYGPGAIGVVLTGSLDDGTAGMMAIKKRGGTAVVQEPKDALYPSMPESVLANVAVDHRPPLSALARLLTRLAYETAPPAVETRDDELLMEVRMAELDADALHDDDRPGAPSPYSCPDCGGVLWELPEREFTRYRCRVGHAYAPETMLSAQDDVFEEALWSAVKTLEESARLARNLADSERQRGHTWLVARFEEKERVARERVEVIRRYLLRTGDSTMPAAAGEAAEGKQPSGNGAAQ